jgi:eukaryotic-like serine/threonine-protein kinase
MEILEFLISDGPMKGSALPFPGQRFLLGSAPDCQLRFDANDMDARAAEVMFDEEGNAWIRDLSPKGQLWINGEKVSQGMLGPGSFLKCGKVELSVRPRGSLSPSGTLAAPTPFRNQRPVPNTDDETFLSGAKPVLKPEEERIDATAHRPTPYQSPANTDRSPAPQTDAKANILPSGYVIDGRYEIVGKIAAGGMGEVYRANHVELGKPMALKVMLPELSRDPEFVGRFKREAIAAGRIGQQNIVDISDFGQTKDGRFYFVMEFLDGLTLASTVHRQGAMKIERAVNVSVQIARALAAAHAQNIVHRDLKPENVMLLQRPGQADFVKVLDFGVAKVTGGKGQGGHTAIGMVVGTPQYMSPEQAKAIVVDARSDIYSLGLIIYELLAGRPTFTGETPSILMVKHVTEAPPAIHPGPLQEVPESLEQLVFQMLEKDPAARPQTMDDVVASLDTLWAQLKSNTVVPRASSGEFKLPPAAESGAAVRVSGGFRNVTSGNVRTLADEEMPLPVKSKTPLVAAALLGVIALGGGAFILLGNKKTEAVLPPPVIAPIVEKAVEPKVNDTAVAPVIAKTKVMLVSVPERAEVYEGDVLIGTAPVSLTRDSGSVSEFKFVLKGYKSLVKKVGFVSEQPIEIVLEKEKSVIPQKKTPGGKGLSDNPYEHQQVEDLKDDPFK